MDNKYFSSIEKELRSMEMIEPPASLKARTVERVFGASQHGGRYPSVPARTLSAAAFVALVLVFTVALNLGNTKSREENQAVNKYLSKVSNYLKSNATWAEPSNLFGNF